MADDPTKLTPDWNPQAGGAVPGMGAVPGSPVEQANAVAAPQMQQLSQFLQQAMAQSMRPRIAQPQLAVPGGPQPMSTTPPAYMTQSRSWGPERFMYGLQATIQNLGVQKQQRDVAHAENQYTYLMGALDKYVTPDGKIDPKAYQDPAVMSIMGNEKELKKMSKALQIDWLNPKPPTPTQQGMQQAIQKRQQQQQARTGLDKLFHSLTNRLRQPTPQMTDEQRMQMAQQVGERAPISMFGGGAEAAETSKMMLQMAQTQKDLQQNWVQATDYSTGRPYVYNKNNPSVGAHYIELTDPDTGKKISPTAKPIAGEGTLASVNGIPYGVKRGGEVITPSMTEKWNANPENQKILDAGLQTHVQSQQERLFQKAPELAGEAGPIPIPPIGLDGQPDRSDPKYLADYKSWADKYRQLKEQEAGDRADLVSEARFNWRTSSYADPNNPGKILMGFQKNIMQHGWQLPSSAESQAAISSLQYFTSQGGATQFTAFRTTLDHADTLMEAAKYLETGDVRTWNLWKNKWKTETGSADVTNFEIVAATFNREVQRTLDAGHITQGEIQEQDLRLPSNASPDQIYGAVSRLKSLLTSKGLELAKQAEAAKKGQIAYPPGIGPQASPAAPGGGGTPAATARTPSPEALAPPKVGDKRMINGQPGRWDGKGWAPDTTK